MMKRPYETMFLLPPTINETQLDEFVEKSKEAIQRKEGEVKEVQRMGVRKTAYQVNNSSTAYYVIIRYHGTGETVMELERYFKNADDVWKFLTTKISDRPTYAPKSKSKLRREENKKSKMAAAAAAHAAAEKTASPAPSVTPSAPTKE